MQWNELPHISRGRPRTRAIWSSTRRSATSAIYVGNGQIIHAPTFGDHVRLASVDVMTPYGYARPG